MLVLLVRAGRRDVLSEFYRHAHGVCERCESSEFVSMFKDASHDFLRCWQCGKMKTVRVQECRGNVRRTAAGKGCDVVSCWGEI